MVNGEEDFFRRLGRLAGGLGQIVRCGLSGFVHSTVRQYIVRGTQSGNSMP